MKSWMGHIVGAIGYDIKLDSIVLRVRVPCRNLGSSKVEAIVTEHLDRFIASLSGALIQAGHRPDDHPIHDPPS